MRFNPLDFPVFLQPPARIRPSTWIEHVPFAMCLLAMTRPRVLVELGTYSGVSYCAFCQAAKGLSLEIQCFAVDTWRGEILEDLRQHHDALYGHFSRLIQSDFLEARSLFEDESIDLLHIDGFHTYDAVKNDYETWISKMSARGVILFHDIAVRENDFGVWKFWEEIKSTFPERHFEFEHGYGLGVLATGDEFPVILKDLFEANPEEAAQVREFFHRAGSLISSLCSLEEEKSVLSASVESFQGSRAVRMATRLTNTRAAALARSIVRPHSAKRSGTSQTQGND
jgi:O-antigen biosynthesis protein